MLVGLTIIGLLARARYRNIEKGAVRSIIALLDSAQTLDQPGKINRLVELNKFTDARILTNVACRQGYLNDREARKPWSAEISRVAGIYLGLLTATPVSRHSLEGLRPARNFLADEYQRRDKGLRGFGDFIIRLALLGTFMGLIAALAIASANIGTAQGSEAEQSEHMRTFIQLLLATAANKFWISAVGIGCAIVIQVYQAMTRHMVFVTRLGDAFDRAIADPDISALWCPRPPQDLTGETHTTVTVDTAIVRKALAGTLSAVDMEPLNKAIEALALEMRASAKNWTLSVSPGRGDSQ
jgi:hypothetical protein